MRAKKQETSLVALLPCCLEASRPLLLASWQAGMLEGWQACWRKDDKYDARTLVPLGSGSKAGAWPRAYAHVRAKKQETSLVALWPCCLVALWPAGLCGRLAGWMQCKRFSAPCPGLPHRRCKRFSPLAPAYRTGACSRAYAHDAWDARTTFGMLKRRFRC